MAKVFNKMASLAGFSEDDFEEFFNRSTELPAAEVGAVLGYLLGRFDCQDAAAMVSVVRKLHPPLEITRCAGRATVNLVGTGGGTPTFNITTTAAFVVAAAGVVVIKTGSYACRSKSGFADVAAKLGTMKVAMPWEQIEAIAEAVGIVFVPPSFHAPVLGRLSHMLTPAVYRNAAGYLNKLGPLLSPVKVGHRVIGAHSARCMEMLAGTCLILGEVPTTLISSDDGLDEASTMAVSRVIHLRIEGTRKDEMIDPQALGIMAPPITKLAGQEPAEAAKCCERILEGKGSREQNEIVALNAAVVLAAVGQSTNLPAAYETARNILRAGDGLRKLNALRERIWKCAMR